MTAVTAEVMEVMVVMVGETMEVEMEAEMEVETGRNSPKVGAVQDSSDGYLPCY